MLLSLSGTESISVPSAGAMLISGWLARRSPRNGPRGSWLVARPAECRDLTDSRVDEDRALESSL